MDIEINISFKYLSSKPLYISDFIIVTFSIWLFHNLHPDSPTICSDFLRLSPTLPTHSHLEIPSKCRGCRASGKLTHRRNLFEVLYFTLKMHIYHMFVFALR